MLYANSSGQNLLEHLRAVSCLATAMAQRLGLPAKLVEACRLAGLWHDLAKAIPEFQEYLQKQIGDGLVLIVDESSPEDLFSKDEPRHQEIGWAFVGSKLHNEVVLQAIYWTHARHIKEDHDYYQDRDEILGTLKACSKAALENIWTEIGIDGSPVETLTVPAMYLRDGDLNKVTNAEWLLVRSCVVGADRAVSAMSAKECSKISSDGHDFSTYLDSMLSGGMHGQTPPCPVIDGVAYDTERYGTQVGCAVDAKDSRTTVVRAPAGFGKTMVGILWSLLRGGKNIWVCPRNAVADAVYDNVIREVEALGLSCSVELYRTGKRQKGYKAGGVLEFDSDIVITNIDAVLSPMVNNRTAGRMFKIFGANVILDEFHEFVSDAPMYAAFITYMRARHRVASSCHTLLLSATPMNIEKMWDSSGRETLVLPKGGKHYPSQHGKPYGVSFSKDLPGSVAGSVGVLSVCNAVRSAQTLFKHEGGYDFLIHHGYTETHRKDLEGKIKVAFGKSGKGESNMAAALVVQAAMDISLRELNDSICSPESSLQRIGRINRWGRESKAQINFVDVDLKEEKSEGGAIRVVYDTGLRALWIEHLKSSIGSRTQVTLDELYVIYNAFYDVYGSKVFSYLKERYSAGLHGPDSRRSFLGLIEMFPISTPGFKKGEQTKTSSKNLRSPEGSWFFSVWDRDNKIWLSPADTMSDGSDLFQRYQEEEVNRRLLDNAKMKQLLKALLDAGYEGHRLRVKKGSPPSGIKGWFYMARNPETPLPDFTREYDHSLGLVDLRIGRKTGNSL